MENVQYLLTGDCSVSVKFGDSINEEINNKVNEFNRIITEYNHAGIIESIPAYSTLLIYYKPEIITYSDLMKLLDELVKNIDNSTAKFKDVVEIPVLYDKKNEFDLEFVAKHNKLSAEDVIAIHSEPEYLIYMLGFTPGFPYLGGMNKKIAAPRLEKPRLKINAGSVGIAGEQTGVYPIDSPGGWQIIGQTPLNLYDANRKDPILLKTGQYIKFKPILKDEFDKIKSNVNNENSDFLLKTKDCRTKNQKGFIVKNPGFLTTIQDLGRYKYQAFGVPCSGAMDHKALKLANLLVDNDINEAGLEVTMLGPTIEFTVDNIIAITGGDLTPLLNNNPIKMYTAISCHNGDVLSFNGIKSGSRAYIAFCGGLSVPTVMRSKSTYIKAKIGGLEGRKLEKGDEVGFEKPKSYLPNLNYRTLNQNNFHGNEITLRVILGPQDDLFTQEGINTFFGSTYTVSNAFDRMGCRLDGDVIEHKKDGNIISDGIAFGAIQVPSQGMPIIMLADRQTVGGYTKIANVISVDLPKLAQAKPGDKITFSNISIEDAQELYLQELREIDEIKINLSKEHNEKTSYYKIKVNNIQYDVSVEEIN